MLIINKEYHLKKNEAEWPTECVGIVVGKSQIGTAVYYLGRQERADRLNVSFSEKVCNFLLAGYCQKDEVQANSFDFYFGDISQPFTGLLK